MGPQAAGAGHGPVELVSIGTSGGNGAKPAFFDGASDDGARAFFETDERLVSGDSDNSFDIYERSAGATTLISTGSGGGNSADMLFDQVSADGARVLFTTDGSLVASDSDAAADVYQRAGGVTSLLSTGPSGGNAAIDATFEGSSQDGARVFVRTAEAMVAADTDSQPDVYERSGGTTTLVSTGSVGGNGAYPAAFRGASADGVRVLFDTAEKLVAADTDAAVDLYERSGTTTTLVSAGQINGNGAYPASFVHGSADGARVLFETNERLVSADGDTQRDLYERAGSTTSLVSTGPVGSGLNIYPASFRGASEDGSRVFFETQEGLTATDVDGGYFDVYERAGGATSLVSIGPGGGADPNDAMFGAASADGTHAFFTTDESLDAGDTDAYVDVYERAAGATTLVSTGPAGGNANLDVFLDRVSDTGNRVFFTTQEALVSQDTDGIAYDVYERTSGATTLVSTGSAGGNGPYDAFLVGSAADGGRVFLTTDERLAAADTDAVQDVYQASIATGYVRPKGAAPIRVPLLPAYLACTSPTLVHGPALGYASCAPPVAASSFLTVGTPTGEGGPGGAANSTGYARLDALVGNPGTSADEADLAIMSGATDVRCRIPAATSCGAANNGTTPVDYAGQLELRLTIRITDRLNGSAQTDPGTVTDYEFKVTLPCTQTAPDPSIGSSCSLATTADTVAPGAVPEGKRSIWELEELRVTDGGADGLAVTTPNTTYLKPGVFAP